MKLHIYFGKEPCLNLNCRECDTSNFILSPFFICPECQSIIFSTHQAHELQKKAFSTDYQYITNFIFSFTLQRGLILGDTWNLLMIYMLYLCTWLYLDIVIFDVGTNPIATALQTLFPQNIRLILKEEFDPNSFDESSLDFVMLNCENSASTIQEDLKIWTQKITPEGFFFGNNKNAPEIAAFLEHIDLFNEGPVESWVLPLNPGLLMSNHNKFKMIDRHIALKHHTHAFTILDDTHPKIQEDQHEKAYYSSRCHYFTGHYDSSLKALKALSTQDKRVQLLRAHLAASQDDFEQAKELCQNALKINSDDYALHHFLGNLYRITKDSKQACEHFNRVIQSGCTHPSAHYLLGSVYQDLDEQKKAYEQYRIGISKETYTHLKIKPSINHITIACVKTGKKYGNEYLHALYHSIQRFCKLPFRFICFTDHPNDIPSHIETIDISSFGLEDYWNKLLLFNYDFHKIDSPIFFTDLDQVITDWIDPFFLIDEDLTMIRNWWMHGFNSSVFLLNTKRLQTIFNSFQKRYMDFYFADEDWIIENHPSCKAWPGTWCQPYFHQSQLFFQEGCRFICFHGWPKPHQSKAKWIKYFWDTKA